MTLKEINLYICCINAKTNIKRNAKTNTNAKATTKTKENSKRQSPNRQANKMVKIKSVVGIRQYNVCLNS